jgi:G:T-mismatch repair DNA endonuclease (very short patch repair protein)
MARDEKTVRELKESDWKPVIVWECKLKDVEKLMERLVQEIFL